jgi:hypothetical protein
MSNHDCKKIQRAWRKHKARDHLDDMGEKNRSDLTLSLSRVKLGIDEVKEAMDAAVASADGALAVVADSV